MHLSCHDKSPVGEEIAFENANDVIDGGPRLGCGGVASFSSTIGTEDGTLWQCRAARLAVRGCIRQHHRAHQVIRDPVPTLLAECVGNFQLDHYL